MQYLGEIQKVATGARSNDLIYSILSQIKRGKNQVKGNFAQRFAKYDKSGELNPIKTAYAVWSFLRKNIFYVKDSPKNQRLFLPSAFYALKKGDCKSYSLFQTSIFTALGLKNGLFFTSYKSKTIPSHVFNYVVGKNGNIIPVDGCYSSFGKMKKPLYIRKIQVKG